MFSRADALQVCQCRNQADGTVTTHSQVADIVEEDDAGGARGIDRLAKQSTDHDVRTARFIHHSGAETIVLARESAPTGQQAIRFRDQDHHSRQAELALPQYGNR